MYDYYLPFTEYRLSAAAMSPRVPRVHITHGRRQAIDHVSPRRWRSVFFFLFVALVIVFVGPGQLAGRHRCYQHRNQAFVVQLYVIVDFEQKFGGRAEAEKK